MSVAELRPFNVDGLPELMGWFADAVACRAWGGPRFRHPFTPETFREDAMIDRLPTWGLYEGRALVGFGQYYLRAGRCHLGRLAVAPSYRRRGLGCRLVRELGRVGRADLQTEEYSLFVLAENRPALALYRGLGFKEAPYPGDPADAACDLYLVAARLAEPNKGN